MARRRRLRFDPGLIGRSGVHLATFALLMLGLGLLVNFTGQVAQSARMERQRQELAAEVARLEEANARLRAEVEYAESGVYAEIVAREQLGLGREGDTVLIPLESVPEAPSAVVVEQPQAELPTPAPNWQRWWWALFP